MLNKVKYRPDFSRLSGKTLIKLIPILSGLALTGFTLIGFGTLNCFAQPDATLVNGSMNYTAATHEISITIDIKNIGNTNITAATGCRIGCYLSTDAVVSNGDYLFFSFSATYGILANAGFKGNTGNVNLTQFSIPSGTYNVLVKADDLNQITETDETNNLFNGGSIVYSAPTGIANYFSNTTSVLASNYPNPFRTSTDFKFFLHEKGLTILKIYDVIGNEVATVVNKELQSGEHVFSFYRNKLPAGIYYYTLASGNFIQTKKLVLAN